MSSPNDDRDLPAPTSGRTLRMRPPPRDDFSRAGAGTADYSDGVESNPEPKVGIQPRRRTS